MLRGVMNVRVWTGGQPRWIVAALLAAVSLIAATSQTIAHEAHGHPARIHEGLGFTAAANMIDKPGQYRPVYPSVSV